MAIAKLTFLTALLACTLRLHAQDERQPEPSVSLDKMNFGEAAAFINAHPDDHGELLFSAMHNRDFSLKLFCVSKIELLGRKDQARLLARVLSDKTLVVPKEEITDGWTGNLQGQLQESLKVTAYKLLNKNPDSLDLFTRSEISAVTSLLNNVQ